MLIAAWSGMTSEAVILGKSGAPDSRIGVEFRTSTEKAAPAGVCTSLSVNPSSLKCTTERSSEDETRLTLAGFTTAEPSAIQLLLNA